ncbi:wound-induced proteinase inhibitor 2-like [Nicotiana tabacum]|uniref:Wound-induced proteinase inhibitor 2-like n=1 Tax=Nicotiana tabacum TaxID=4097 RepID=A0A1S3Z2Q3_TOBAC|nr:PREDICTED: wound-induced proteinase inhibitor 2-like [Nicotiana tabacum]
MAVHKVGFLSLLLLFGTFLLLSEVDYADAKACTRNCNPRIRYGRCPKSGNKKFNVGCTNCCAGSLGCNYYSANGTFVCEGESETKVETIETDVETIETEVETMVESNKVCPRNCDPKIRYGRCPKSGNKKFNVGCTNCCAAKKGCNYFSANGTFVCEGETETKVETIETEVETMVELNKVCPFNCDGRISYSVCGNKKSSGRICTNCCAARKGCNYFSADGTFVCKGESVVESMIEAVKPCRRNCDGRISYSVCGNKKSSGRICTNCCAGKKGCNYFSADGTFVCEGESGVESI